MDNNQNHFLSYLNRNTYDGHGGRARMHHEEMEAIARRVYAEEHEKDKKEMQEIAYKCYQQAIADFLHAIEYDIESIVSVGIDGCRDIFVDKKTQKFISDRIQKEIQKRLNNKQFRK